MPLWVWLAVTVYVLGFTWGFVSSARRSVRSGPLYPVFDPACAGIVGGLLWPFVLLVYVAVATDHDHRGSRAVRKAERRRRVAEEQLREAEVLRERERLLGL